MKKILQITILMLSILIMSTGVVFAETVFSPTLNIDNTVTGKITVTVSADLDNEAILAVQKPSLAIPCEFEKAHVEYNGQKIESTLADGEITFVVEKSGSYVIVKDENTTTPTRPSSGRGGGGGSSSKKEETKVEEEIKPEWKNPFKDVKEEDWFYESVKYANENNLFKGATETKFEPNSPMTRGMMITVLWRMEKEPVVNYLMMFEDVNQEEYYAEAIRWASSEKIVQGHSITQFKPDEMLTREEMVTMLYRYAMYKEKDMVTEQDVDLTKFVDHNSISDYAMEAMKWSVEKGIIKGMSEISLAPVTLTARCEVAAVMMRFMNI